MNPEKPKLTLVREINVGSFAIRAVDDIVLLYAELEQAQEQFPPNVIPMFALGRTYPTGEAA